MRDVEIAIGESRDLATHTAAAAVANWVGVLSPARSGFGTIRDSHGALSTPPWSTRP